MNFTGEPPSIYRKGIELEERKESEQKEEELPKAEDWEYAVDAKALIDVGGREMKMMIEDNDEILAGDVVRQMMESRRYRPESYTWVGYTKNPNRGVEEVGIPHTSLFRHTAFFGTTGYGKSTVVKNLLLQWMQAGWGLCFIDPKGDDSQDILKSLPEHRLEDVIWAEPGNTDRQDTVGFNFFDTYAEAGTREQQEEAQQLTSDFVELLKAELQGGRRGDDWTPEMGGVSKAIVGQLVRAKEDYTIIDFYKVLDSNAEREAFLDMYGDNLEDIERDYIENLNPRDVSELTEKVKEMATNKVTREMLAYEGSAISISEVVEEGKILLMNTSNLEDEQKLISSAISRRIWSKIKARKDIPMEERTPFFLAIDEFDDVARNRDDDPNRLKIEKILSKARSLRLAVLLANQQPSQLADAVQEAMYGNCDNLFTFNPGEFQDANSLSKGVGDIDSRQLMELGKFKILGRVTIDGDKSEGLLINTFPEYPPIRSEEDAEEFVAESVDRYGLPQKRDTSDLSQYGVVRFQQQNDAEVIEYQETEITERHVLAAIIGEAAARSVSIDGKDDWVNKRALETVFERHLPEIDFDRVKSDLLRPNIGSLVQQTEDDDKEYFRATEEGRDSLIPAGEDEEYGRLTREGLIQLCDLGYLTLFPIGEQDEIFFQGEGLPPINPVEDASTVDEAEQLYRALEGTYSELADKFSDKTVMLSPTTDPRADIREVVESIKTAGRRHTVLVVNEEPLPDEKKPAETIHEFLAGETPLVEKEIDEDRFFFSTSEPISVEDGTRALHRSNDAQWRERGDRLVLEAGESQDIATFDEYDEIETSVERSDFPYHAERTDIEEEDEEGTVVGDDRVTIVYNDDGEKVDQYEDLDNAVADGYELVHEPFIPEYVLDSSTPPSQSQWDILVIPKEGEPYFFEEQAIFELE